MAPLPRKRYITTSAKCWISLQSLSSGFKTFWHACSQRFMGVCSSLISIHPLCPVHCVPGCTSSFLSNSSYAVPVSDIQRQVRCAGCSLEHCTTLSVWKNQLHTIMLFFQESKYVFTGTHIPVFFWQVWQIAGPWHGWKHPLSFCPHREPYF